MKPDLHPFVRLARESVRYHLDHGEPMGCPSGLPEIFDRRAGVFVTVHKRDRLRGCIGTLTPQTENLAEEILRNAVQAAFHDPRFPPLMHTEWPEVSFAVEVLTPPVKVSDVLALDPKVHGLVVRSEKKQGVLLPGIEGVNTIQEQVFICRQKGRISEAEPQEYFRFEVESYH